LSPARIEILKSEGADDPGCDSTPPVSTPRVRLVTTTYLGIEVVKHENDLFGDKLEEWRAPSLNCEVLYSRLTLRDGRGNETKAINVVKGDPDAAFFSISSELQERSPSEIMKLAAEKSKSVISADVQKRLPMMDKRYNETKAEPIQLQH
jgi:hypothetical protein